MIYLKEIEGILSEAPIEFRQNIEWMIDNGYNPYNEVDYAQYLAKSKTFSNGTFIDTPTEEYIEKQLENKKYYLQSQIDEFDKKRVRAIAEPSIKDIATGQTWLEYYTEQIVALRAELAGL